MIIITGASGQLGRLVIDGLLKRIPANQIVAAVRNPDRVSDLTSRGVQVRQADYDKPETLERAFHGGDKLLLISSSEVGRRVKQHRNVIDAAKRAGVELIAYTSILHADLSPLPLAKEHRETEAAIRASGLPFVFLRNGWYTENYLAGIPTALHHGVLLGTAGEGRIASAVRADYAEAAVAVLLKERQEGRVYELAGDDAYTLAELASSIASLSGKAVSYGNLPAQDYMSALTAAGLPEDLARLITESDIGVAKGGLFDDSRQLSTLIGRPTLSLSHAIEVALHLQAGQK